MFKKIIYWFRCKCIKCGSDKTDWRGAPVCKAGCDFHVPDNNKYEKIIDKSKYRECTGTTKEIKTLTEKEFKDGEQGYVWMDNETGKLKFDNEEKDDGK